MSLITAMNLLGGDDADFAVLNEVHAVSLVTLHTYIHTHTQLYSANK